MTRLWEKRDLSMIFEIRRPGKTYHKDANIIGFPKEEFAIAVVLDVSHDEAEHPWPFLLWVKGLFEESGRQFC